MLSWPLGDEPHTAALRGGAFIANYAASKARFQTGSQRSPFEIHLRLEHQSLSDWRLLVPCCTQTTGKKPHCRRESCSCRLQAYITTFAQGLNTELSGTGCPVSRSLGHFRLTDSNRFSLRSRCHGLPRWTHGHSDLPWRRFQRIPAAMVGALSCSCGNVAAKPESGWLRRQQGTRT